jgi:glucose-1-phosphate thymidylyltransferase
VTEFGSYRADALIPLKEMADPMAFGVAQLDGSGRVITPEEKPTQPRSNSALTEAYAFSPTIHWGIESL